MVLISESRVWLLVHSNCHYLALCSIDFRVKNEVTFDFNVDQLQCQCALKVSGICLVFP